MAISANTGATASLSSAATTLAFASNTLTNGQYVVIAVAILSASVTVSGISDTANAYTLQAAETNSSGVRVELWAAKVTAATGSCTITITFSGSVLASAAYEEYSGPMGIGNIGTAAMGTGQYAESDVTTQYTSSWGVCAIAAATNSGDTFSADLGTIRQSRIPALATAAVALVDNTTVAALGLRQVMLLSTSRVWAAAAVELISSTSTTAIGAVSGTGPVAASHQIVAAPPLIVGDAPLPIAEVLQSGIVGTVYSETISGINGTSPYTFTLSTGTLPSGCILAGATGIIAGTPTAAGTYNFTIEVTDANGLTGSFAFEIVISAASSMGGGNFAWAA